MPREDVIKILTKKKKWDKEWCRAERRRSKEQLHENNFRREKGKLIKNDLRLQQTLSLSSLDLEDDDEN